MKTWTEKEMRELADDALNAACLVMQEAVGQTDGGFAGIWFSGDEVRDNFVEYIRREIEGVAFDRGEQCES
jgi:hypothetical protein